MFKLTKDELEEKIRKILNEAGCILLEKCPAMGIDGIISLAEKISLKQTIAQLCKDCSVKTAGKCSGKQKEINKALKNI